ncbi:BatD family protein [Empedobacter stercoris]|uniref:BatD family protein n=1 Tax=Empedobacter stercoris TaxID=1628248 RepID=UPI0021AFD3C0|nr:BatD family protein [Empedobacter stercoris]UWX66101.1 BatD family protein [Empedobacter stercoris]
MKNLLLLVSFFILNFSFAQEIMPKLDRTTFKVGEPIQYEIKIDFKKGDKIVFPTISDSLNYHIEVLDQKIDTVKTEGKSEIVQQLELTGFEAGKFTIPSFIIQKNDKDLTTKQLEIEIQDVEVDTTKNAIFPIKPVMEEEYSIRDYWNKYWLYGIIAFILFIIAAVLLILYIRAKSKLSGDKLYKTPYDEAKASLKALDAKKYLKRGEQKEYYTQLSFIVRRYLGRVYNFSALEILSDDLVKYIATKQDVLPDDVQKFKQFLFDADLVKFAKQEFDDSTNNMHRNWVDEFVERIKPIEIPENEDLNKDQVTGEKYKQFNNN